MKYVVMLQGFAAARKRKPAHLAETRQPLNDVDGQDLNNDNNNDDGEGFFLSYQGLRMQTWSLSSLWRFPPS